jgi:hypothetical protein
VSKNPSQIKPKNLRPKGGRERERKREPTGNPCIPTGSLSVSNKRFGQAWVLAGDPTFCFIFDLSSDVTDSLSRSRRPSQSPVRGRRRRTREREGEMRSREIYFFWRERNLVLSFKKKKMGEKEKRRRRRRRRRK